MKAVVVATNDKLVAVKVKIVLSLKPTPFMSAFEDLSWGKLSEILGDGWF
jgi:hypothetical protein